MTDQIMAAAAGLTALLALLLAAVALRARGRAAGALAEARAETAVLRERLDALELRSAPVPRPEPVDQEFVITRLGEPEPVAPAPTVEGRLFADLVLRESVVQAASLAHGVRRALAPEVRNRIRFEMRREVKLARKRRRAELREAKRAWQTREGTAA
ncbi:hypothetical protein [Nocardioides dongkuii]|uniref:hypothetical protein n=1 Tax=Nocardioides dongkuii TaxID=2760089 RepID=UPI0015F7DFC3|nr:hypothetical protein [Nocardioides dongkuii]